MEWELILELPAKYFIAFGTGTHFDPLDEAVWKIFFVCATGCLVCRRSKPLYALGYGLSFLICLVTVIVGVFLESSMLLETADGALPQQHYHENNLCWLNQSSYGWVFNGYVIAVLLFNTAMLFLGARAYMRVSRPATSPYCHWMSVVYTQ